MATLPTASVRVDDEAGAFAGASDYIAIFAPVETNADLTPRVFANAKAILAKHGYAKGVDYAALHIQDTRKPVIFIGMPSATNGAASAVDDAGVSGTSAITVAGNALDDLDCSITVVTGGTVGTAGIVVDISCDGGRTKTRKALGTATTYAIPYTGLTVTFGTGTLVAGDVATFTATEPMWGQSDLTTAREALAAQQKQVRSWIVIGDCATDTVAGYVVTEANAFETSNERFVYARVSVRDQNSGESKSTHVSAMDTEFAPIGSEKRIDISLGRARRLSPITGRYQRRPACWAASIREYQNDLHVATYAKQLGPLSGWDLFDDAGQLAEFDERIDGGALAARFTCLRTYANGPTGAFVALSLTRAPEASLLSRTHNMSVCNLACSIAHAETENAIGQSLTLNSDGTATVDALQKIEGRVNSTLIRELLADKKKQGPRATKAVWQASRADVLNVPGATLTGVLTLELNGTIENIETSVRVQTGG